MIFKIENHDRKCQSKKYQNMKMIRLKVVKDNLNISYLIDIDYLYNNKYPEYILLLKDDYLKHKKEIQSDIKKQVDNLLVKV